MSRIVVLDYGSGNLRSAERALRRVGADVTVTADRHAAMEADGLVVPGVGAYAACMAGLRAVDGPSVIDHRLAGGRPVLGICVGMQVLFDRGVERDERTDGCGEWPGTVERLKADVLPHMGWNTVRAPMARRSSRAWTPTPASTSCTPSACAGGSWRCRRRSARRWSRGPITARTSWPRSRTGRCAATQFHPEKSGDAGAPVLRNWLRDVVG